MPVYILDAPVRKIYHQKYDWWELTEDAYLVVEGRPIIVPKGYVSDFASVPRWVPDWVIPRNGLSAMPAVGHDWLCSQALVPEEVANLWFYSALLEAGVPRLQAQIMYSYCETYAVFRYGENAKIN